MDKLENEIRQLGVTLDKANAKTFDEKKLVKIMNNECHKFCSESDSSLKKLYFVQYLHKRIKEKYSSEPGKCDDFFNGVLYGLQMRYKELKELKIFLKFFEKSSNGLRETIIIYMKMRKFVLEANSKSNDHEIPLADLIVTKETLEGFCKKLNIDPKAVQETLKGEGADISQLKGPEFALACIKNGKGSSSSSSKPSGGGGSSKGFGSKEDMEKYKKPPYLLKVIEDRENNLGAIGKILFKLHADSRFNSAIRGDVSEYESLFMKYLRHKTAEKGAKICGTINNEFSKKREDKKVIIQVIRLYNANADHIIRSLKGYYDKDMDDDLHKSYHSKSIKFYLCEYLKKSCMIKYTEVYDEISGTILDTPFEKNSSIDKTALDVMKELESRLINFMDERALKSKLNLS